ncbi:hypothetical protein SDC9_151582 [bioreactor metagenome]|uniref:Uncharacterized protein n=1 Tax=bioreactor metagenome TaxID=1076179 RepID=A0A645EQP3_9ZZZZ
MFLTGDLFDCCCQRRRSERPRCDNDRTRGDGGDLFANDLNVGVSGDLRSDQRSKLFTVNRQGTTGRQRRFFSTGQHK